MNNLYFQNVNNIGNLYLDYVFIEFEAEPIIFTCRDDFNSLYLCLCSEIRNGQKWMVTKIDTKTLTKLVNDELDIASAFLINSFITSISMDMSGNESSKIVKKDDIDRLDLPKEGTCLNLSKEKIIDYAECLKQFNSNKIENKSDKENLFLNEELTINIDMNFEEFETYLQNFSKSISEDSFESIILTENFNSSKQNYSNKEYNFSINFNETCKNSISFSGTNILKTNVEYKEDFNTSTVNVCKNFDDKDYFYAA